MKMEKVENKSNLIWFFFDAGLLLGFSRRALPSTLLKHLQVAGFAKDLSAQVAAQRKMILNEMVEQ